MYENFKHSGRTLTLIRKIQTPQKLTKVKFEITIPWMEDRYMLQTIQYNEILLIPKVPSTPAKGENQ